MSQNIATSSSIAKPHRNASFLPQNPFAKLRLLVVPTFDQAANELLLLRATAWTRLHGGEAFVLDVLTPHLGVSPLLHRVADREDQWVAYARAEMLQRLDLEQSRDWPASESIPSEKSIEELTIAAAAAIDASLVMVPRPQRCSRVARAAFDRLAITIVRRTELPCLVVGTPKSSTSILAATDMTDPQFPVLHYANAVAARIDGDITLLHNVDDFLWGSLLSGFAGTNSLLSLVRSQHFADRVRCRLDAAAASAYRDTQPLVLNEPNTAAAIVAEAEKLQCDLIVTGTHQSQKIRFLPRFSTAEAVVQQASCSVLVVPLYAAEAQPKHIH